MDSSKPATEPDDVPTDAPDPAGLTRDPEALKQAHSRYGNYLKKVGLPFEPEEFDDDATEPAPERPSTDASKD